MGFEQLWAPWRLGYLQGEESTPLTDGEALQFLPGADPECFVCQSAADDNDRRRLVIDRTGHSLTLLNRYPYNNGHLLVSPKRHQGRLDQLTAAELLDTAQTVARMIALLERVLHPAGFNVGLNLGLVAGAGLPGHLHWHIVPRWNGDTNFMPALAAVKVIPQSLESLWEALTAPAVE
ncbi:MAG: HIT family protein [Thermoguttaceae bacterium]